MSKIEIQVFASLKNFFQQNFEITKPIDNIEELTEELKNINPTSAPILKISRFAVNEEFVSKEYKLKENDKVAIIPPSSGG